MWHGSMRCNRGGFNFLLVATACKPLKLPQNELNCTPRSNDDQVERQMSKADLTTLVYISFELFWGPTWEL